MDAESGGETMVLLEATLRRIVLAGVVVLIATETGF